MFFDEHIERNRKKTNRMRIACIREKNREKYRRIIGIIYKNTINLMET